MSIVQIGGDIPSDIEYDNIIDLPFKWDHKMVDQWLADYNDQRKGWATVKPDIRNHIVRIMFELDEDRELFENTFDFEVWKQ